jgi:hypothetical protein
LGEFHYHQVLHHLQMVPDWRILLGGGHPGEPGMVESLKKRKPICSRNAAFYAARRKSS